MSHILFSFLNHYCLFIALTFDEIMVLIVFKCRCPSHLVFHLAFQLLGSQTIESMYQWYIYFHAPFVFSSGLSSRCWVPVVTLSSTWFRWMMNQSIVLYYYLWFLSTVVLGSCTMVINYKFMGTMILTSIWSLSW